MNFWRIFTVGLISVSLAFAPFASGQDQRPNETSSSAPQTIQKLSEIESRWRPDTHLFIRGETGLGPSQIDELSLWLSRNASHWLVVLLDDATGEIYSNASRHFSGVDAVEVQLGEMLSNKTDFGKLLHPTTNQPDGAVLVFMMKQRRVSYFASETQNSHSLGESQWKGNLDQPAIRAMRSGGRVIDAIKNTIQNIDGLLAKSIQRESESAIAKVQANQRDFNAFQTSLASVDAGIAETVKHHAQFLHVHPHAMGPLQSPPIEKWKTSLQEFRTDGTLENFRPLRPNVESLQREIHDYLHAFAAAEGVERLLESIQSRTGSLRANDDHRLIAGLTEIEKRIAETRRAANNGDFDVDAKIHDLEQAVQTHLAVRNTVEATKAFQREVWTWVQRIVLVMVALFAGALAWFWRLQRLRLTNAKRRAEQELARREEDVQKETERIHQLFTRTNDLLGSRDRIDKRGYEGATRDVANRIFDYVDGLFILSKETRRVIAMARSKIYPNEWSERWENSWSAKNYAEGLALLSGKVLVFEESQGLPRILRETTGEEYPANSNGEVGVTFEDAFALLTQHTKQASDLLVRFEKALTGSQDQLNEVQAEFIDLHSVEQQAWAPSGSSIQWGLPSFLNRISEPLAQAIREADAKALYNPIDVFESRTPEIQSVLVRLRRLWNEVLRGKDELFPKSMELAKPLQSLGFSTDWITTEFQSLIQNADQLVAGTIDDKGGFETTLVEMPLRARFDALIDQLRGLHSIAEVLTQDIPDRLSELKSAVADSKQSIAERLNLKAESIQFGKDSTTTEKLRRAEADFSAAKQLVGRGDVQSAESCVEQGLQQLDAIEASMRTAIKIADEFPMKKAKLLEEIQREKSRHQMIAKQIVDMKSRYLPSALAVQISSSLRTESEPVQTLEDVLELAKVQRGVAEESIQQASMAFSEGRLVHASDGWDESELHLHRSQQFAVGLESFAQALEQQESRNQAQVDEIEKWFGVLEKNLSDRQVMKATLEALTVAIRSARAALHLATSGTPSDPRSVAKELAQISERLHHLQAKIVADRRGYAEAARAVAGAVAQWQTAWNLVQASQGDGIPDSPQTTNLNAKIGQSKTAIEALKVRLDTPHGHWQDIDRDAYQLQTSIDSLSRSLATELSDASNVYQSFQSASQAVFNAENWIGKRGTQVSVHEGAEALERARLALQKGNYQQTLEHSQTAMEIAKLAIQAAERNELWLQVADKKRQEKMRRERANRTWGGGRQSSDWGLWPTIMIGGADWLNQSGSSSGSFFGGSSDSSSSSGFGGDFGGGSSGGGDWGGSSGNSSGFSGSEW